MTDGTAKAPIVTKAVDVLEWQYAVWNRDVDPDIEGQHESRTGLISASRTDATVICGTDSGSVLVEVFLATSRPGRPEDIYAEVAEVSIRSDNSALIVGSGFTGDFATIELPAPGDYRMRVSARGRDEAHAHGLHVPAGIERHEMTLWPEAWSPAQNIQVTDDLGRAFGRPED